MNTTVLKKNSISVINYWLIITILLFFSRTVIPLFKYPFALMYSIIVLYFFLKYGKEIPKGLYRFSVAFIWPIIMLTIMGIAFYLTKKIYIIILKDIINSVIIFSFFLILQFLTINESELKKFLNNLLNLIVLFAFLISVERLMTLFDFFNGFSTSLLPNFISVSSSSSIDENFALILIIFSMVILTSKLSRVCSGWRIFLISCMMILFSTSIFFSGSRRGLIILALLIAMLILNQFLSLFYKERIVTNLARSSLLFLSLVIILSISTSIFVLYTSFSFKNRVLEVIGCDNPNKVRREITARMIKYTKVVSRIEKFSDLYKKIWARNINPLDPDSGWGTRIHKTIFPLYGDNVEIVPAGSMGYLLDKTSNADTWNGNSYSYTTIYNDILPKNKIISASAFCFVSKDFNGTWVNLTCEDPLNGSMVSEYNLEMKGVWQELRLQYLCNGGIVPIHLYFSKYGVTDFSTLSGYVIFAHPVVILEGTTDNLLSALDLDSSYQEYSLHTKEQNPLPSDIGRISYDITDHGEIDRTMLMVEKDDNVNKPFRVNSLNPFLYAEDSYASLLVFAGKRGFLENYNKEGSKFLRNWINKLTSEDTTYYDLRSNLKTTISGDFFISERTNRWKFAAQIFLNEYNMRQKIFGGGFIYLNWYGYYFLKDKTALDWPHNPFLSILLYSGLIGLLLYLFFLYKVLYYYFKYRKGYLIFIVFFIIISFFSFFSGGSPFDPPIMGFFTLLPFFIHAVNKDDKVC
jgi:hypothetical protein